MVHATISVGRPSDPEGSISLRSGPSATITVEPTVEAIISVRHGGA